MNNPPALPELNIIGCGHTGKVLARLWHDRRVFAIGVILNRTTASTEDAARFIGAGSAAARIDDMAPAPYWMISANDDAIGDCANALADSGKLGPDNIVFHCSGSLPSATLSAVKETGALTASLHPVNSFADPQRDIENFTGTCGALEGDEEAVKALAEALSAIGGNPVTIRPDRKPIYHAAAVFACNYLTTVIETGLQCAAEAGLERAEAQKLLMPLILNTIENIGRMASGHALTGPIARGDNALVEKQLAALEEWNPDIARLYAALGRRTSALAPRLSPEERGRLADTLKD